MTYNPNNPNGQASSANSQPVVTASDQKPGAYAQRVDEVDPVLMFIGIAAVGTLDGDSTWQIKRIDFSGPLTIITWAEGNASFDKVWDDRADYTYS